MTITDRVHKIFMEHLLAPPAVLTNEATIAGDLDADSLEQVEIVMALEQEFDLSISDDEAEAFYTVGDVVAYVEKSRT